MKKVTLFSILMAGLLLAGAVYLTAFRNTAASSADVRPEADAKAVSHTEDADGSELLDARGKAVNFSDFRGKVVFVNSWASWCPPCVAEMPTIAKLRQVLAGKEVAFVMVSFDQQPQKGLQWMQQKEFELPVYFPGPAYPQKLITDAIPATFVLDRQGRVVHTQLGMADYSQEDFVQQMEQWIQQ